MCICLVCIEQVTPQYLHIIMHALIMLLIIIIFKCLGYKIQVNANSQSQQWRGDSSYCVVLMRNFGSPSKFGYFFFFIPYLDFVSFSIYDS